MRRLIPLTLPFVICATVAAVGWHPSVYFSQKDPDEPFHELHGRRLGCIVGIMTDPATGQRLGPISRTYLCDGKKIGKAKMGGGCMYIKSLDGVDQKVLAELITTAMQAKVQRYPSKAKVRKKA